MEPIAMQEEHSSEDMEQHELMGGEPTRHAQSRGKVVLLALVAAAAVVFVASRSGGAIGGVSTAGLDDFVELDVLAGCSEPGKGCLESKCCTLRDHFCYEKNEHWADCKKTCAAGEVDPNSEKKWQAPWTCEILTPEGECTPDDGDCSKSRCCTSPTHKCYMKSKYYAGCRSECTAGEKFEHDPEGHQIPWDCTLIDKSAGNSSNSSNDSNDSNASNDSNSSNSSNASNESTTAAPEEEGLPEGA